MSKTHNIFVEILTDQVRPSISSQGFTRMWNAASLGIGFLLSRWVPLPHEFSLLDVFAFPVFILLMGLLLFYLEYLPKFPLAIDLAICLTLLLSTYITMSQSPAPADLGMVLSLLFWVLLYVLAFETIWMRRAQKDDRT